MAGTLRPGDKMREVEIAQSIGVSRTPVREAIHRLKADGLVTQEPNRGAVVRRLDYGSISELYKIREVLEGTAAGLAARHMSDVELNVLHDMIDRQRTVRDDIAEASRLNKLFHRTIAQAAQNRYLLEMIDGLDLSMALLGPSTLGIEARKEEALSEHLRLVDALASRDPARAGTCAAEHIRNAYAARLTILMDGDGAELG